MAKNVERTGLFRPFCCLEVSLKACNDIQLSAIWRRAGEAVLDSQRDIRGASATTENGAEPVLRSKYKRSNSEPSVYTPSATQSQVGV